MQVPSSQILLLAQHCANLMRAPAILGITSIIKEGRPPASSKRGAPSTVEVTLEYGAQGNALLHLAAGDAVLDLPVHQLSDVAQSLRALCLGIEEFTIPTAKPAAPKVWTSADAIAQPAAVVAMSDIVKAASGTSKAEPAIIAVLRQRSDVSVEADSVTFHGRQGAGVADQLKAAGYKWDVRHNKSSGENRWILRVA
jgi:hypothetical protein